MGGWPNWLGSQLKGFTIHDIFRTASPFSGVQSNTDKFGLQIALEQRGWGA